MAEHWVMKRCPICGKEYLPAAQHGWAIKEGTKKELVCSYTCQRKYEKNPKMKIKKRSNKAKIAVKVIETGEEFKSITECAEHFNVSTTTIHHCLYHFKTLNGLHLTQIIE